MNEIVVIGSSNIDMIMKMDHLPAKGETVTNAEFDQVFGGKGANQAVAAARAGGDVAFISCVGDDANARPMVDSFKLDSINTEYVFRETSIPSGTALIMIGENGENYISVAPGANYRLTPAYIDTTGELIRNAEVILLQYEILPETLAYAIRKAQQHKCKVILNFAPARKFDRDLLSLVDILVVNVIEAGYLAGLEISSDAEIDTAADKIHALGVSSLIITLGANGSFVSDHARRFRVPAFRVKTIDTTAAGDTYCGCLTTALTEGKNMEDAVRFASAAASISVTRMGAQPSAPTRKEIDDFLNAIA